MNTIVSPLAKMRRRCIPRWPGFSSQERTAERLRISKIHLAQVETGKTACSDDLIERMAKLYEVQFETVKRAMREARRGYLERQLERSFKRAS